MGFMDTRNRAGSGRPLRGSFWMDAAAIPPARQRDGAGMLPKRWPLISEVSSGGRGCLAAVLREPSCLAAVM